MLVVDELKNRKRALGLMFFDFVEGLARLADYISPPSMEYLLGGEAPSTPSSPMRDKELAGHPLEVHLKKSKG